MTIFLDMDVSDNVSLSASSASDEHDDSLLNHQIKNDQPMIENENNSKLNQRFDSRLKSNHIISHIQPWTIPSPLTTNQLLQSI